MGAHGWVVVTAGRMYGLKTGVLAPASDSPHLHLQWMLLNHFFSICEQSI